MTASIGSIDAVIIIVYLLGLIFIGYLLGRKNKDQEDYFLAGRSMPWLPIALSVAATMLSAGSFVGGPGWAYSAGLTPFLVNITVPLAILLVLYTTIPVIYHSRVTSVYQYVELRLGPVCRTLSVIGFLANSTIQIGSFVFVPALILQQLTGWDMVVIVPLIVLSAIIYTLLGGIKAVIWTDTLQMLIFWGGLISAFVIILRQTGLSFSDTLAIAAAKGKLQALDFSFDYTKITFWASLIGATFMWIRYFGFDQGQVQRILTAKSARSVKSSFTFSAIMMNVVYFICLLIGVMLFVMYDGRKFASANDIMIDFILNYMPVGVIGLMISGIFAAAMSSIDSLLNSMTTVFVKDIYERYMVKGEALTSLRLSMLLSAVWGIIIIIFTILAYVGATKSILDTVGSYITYISGPMLGILVLSMFTDRANDRGSATGMIAGFILTFLFGKNVGAHWLWNPLVGALFTTTIGYIASRLLKQPLKRDIAPYTVRGLRTILLGKKSETGEETVLIPLQFDKQALLLFVFFIAQYLFLLLIT